MSYRTSSAGGLKDPRVAPWTSVVAAEVAPDLKTCKAYISVLGDAYEQEQTIKGAGRVQKAISVVNWPEH